MPESRPNASGPSVSIIAPCFNEQDNIGPLVARAKPVLDALPEGSELVLVDDGSSDATWERITGHAAADPRIAAVHHDHNQGIEAGWRSGLRAATGDLVCLIDADLQNRPEDVLRLYERYRAEPRADLVQAVRKPVAGVRRLHLFSRGLNLLLNTTFGMRLRDNKSGFLLCDHSVLEAILHHRLSYRYFQALVGVSAGARGLRVAEVETPFEHRHAGQSFLSRMPVLVSLRICWELAKFRVETLVEPKGRS